jgi:hypothetical protein
LFAAFLLLGGILNAVDPADDEPGSPTTSDTPTVSTPPSRPARPAEMPTVTTTATVTATLSPAPAETVTKTAEAPEPPPPPPTTTAPAPDVYYENCDEARAAGDAPLHRGDPGYAPHLDRDGDGVACEPYPGT